jgi:hypothetical protein
LGNLIEQHHRGIKPRYYPMLLSGLRRGAELFSVTAEDGGSRVAGQAAGVVYWEVLKVARSVLMQQYKEV